MSKEAFKRLFVEELQDIYDAENQIVQSLPEAIKAAEYPELRDALKKHLEETKKQVQRLETIFTQIKENRSGTTCTAMQGLIQELKKSIQDHPSSLIRDVALIAAAQRIEHYEIAVYGTLRTYAKQLELDDAAKLLKESLNEEKNADETLNDIAEGGFFTTGINKKAERQK